MMVADGRMLLLLLAVTAWRGSGGRYCCCDAMTLFAAAGV